MTKNTEKLAILTNKEFTRTAKKLQKSNTTMFMPTYIPQRGRMLDELNKLGVETIIAGGKKGSQIYKSTKQYGLKLDPSSVAGIFPEEVTKDIVNAVPAKELKNKNVAIYSYVGSLGWSGHLKNRNLGTKTVATNEQNLRKFFEEKGNLLKILQSAGLEKHIIPTKHISGKENHDYLKKVYEQLKNEDGKVVIQGCKSKDGNAGGKGTAFASNFQEFLKESKEMKGHKKVVRFVDASEANLSFFSGNMKASNDFLGAERVNLPKDYDCFNPENLNDIAKMAKAKGINKDNIVTMVGRATLKAVGDKALTNNKANGVGNDLGYVYNDKLQKQIANIGDRLSSLMAICGRVGLAGADLMIDKKGHIWINEINDRQQGPTDQMSIDAEKNKIPSLMKMSLIASFGDMNDPKTQSFMKEMQTYRKEVHREYSNSKGSFYLKVHATHPKHEKAFTKTDLKQGYYKLEKDKKTNKWNFDKESYMSLDKAVDETSNPKKGHVWVKLVGGDIKKGDEIPSGSQMFRIVGKSEKECPPLILENGKTIVNNNEWRNIVKSCYEHLMGDNYCSRNPLENKNVKQVKTATNTNKAINKVIKLAKKVRER